MQTWEYFIRPGNLDIHSLNHLGEEGWEVVNVVPSQSICNAGQTLIQYDVLFKRPLKAGSGVVASTFRAKDPSTAWME